MSEVSFVKECLKNWNEMRDGATHRNRLRERARSRGLSLEDYVQRVLSETSSVVASSRGGKSYTFSEVKKIIQEIHRLDSVGPVCEAILNSGWDFVDVGWRSKTKSGRMDKSPEEVEEFLRSLADGFPISFRDLDEGRRGLVKTICDSYLRSAS